MQGTQTDPTFDNLPYGELYRVCIGVVKGLRERCYFQILRRKGLGGHLEGQRTLNLSPYVVGPGFRPSRVAGLYPSWSTSLLREVF